MKKTKAAFHWITEILEKNKVPYQIAGGLAARAYGSTRPLNDIDIDIPENSFSDIIPEIKPYIISGPEWVKDNVWDIYNVSLVYQEQEIDISGAFEVKIRDERTGVWHAFPTDFSKTKQKLIFGKLVPVIDPEILVKYKTILAVNGHEHQKGDVEAIKKHQT